MRTGLLAWKRHWFIIEVELVKEWGLRLICTAWGSYLTLRLICMLEVNLHCGDIRILSLLPQILTKSEAGTQAFSFYYNTHHTRSAYIHSQVYTHAQVYTHKYHKYTRTSIHTQVSQVYKLKYHKYTRTSIHAQVKHIYPHNKKPESRSRINPDQ